MSLHSHLSRLPHASIWHSPLVSSATELTPLAGPYSPHSSGGLAFFNILSRALFPTSASHGIELDEMAATKRFARICWSCVLTYAECNQVRQFNIQGGAHHRLFERQPCCSVIRTYHHPCVLIERGLAYRPRASSALGRVCLVVPKPTSLPDHPAHVPTSRPVRHSLTHARNNSLVGVPRPVRPSRSEGFIRPRRP